MSWGSAIQETFSSRPLRGELSPTGALDRMAGVGLVLAGLLYLVFVVFGGLIRGVFGSVGLTALIYTPSAVAAVALVANTLVRIGDPRTSVATIAVIGFIAVESAISLFLGRPPAAIAFQVYLFFAAFVMMALTQRQMHDRLINMMVPVFFIAAFGVLLNVFIAFPWADATYEVMGVQREAAREWSAYGQSRLAGFSRASYNASSQIFLAYCVVESRTKSFALRSLWWGVGLVAVYYTTSKSPLLAMLLLPATYFIIGRIRDTGGARRQLFANLLMGFWVLLIFAGPFLSMTYGPQLYPKGIGTGMGYSSLADRVLNTWPNAIALIDWHNPISWFVGRGFGGIGAAQTIFEPALYNPGDNLAVYLFVIFGLGAFAIAYLIFRGGNRAIASGQTGRRDFVLIVAMLGVATAANVAEATLPMMVLGMAMAYQRSRSRVASGRETGSGSRRRTRSRAQVDSADQRGGAGLRPQAVEGEA